MWPNYLSYPTPTLPYLPQPFWTFHWGFTPLIYTTRVTSKKRMRRVAIKTCRILQCVMTLFYKTCTTTSLISFKALVSSHIYHYWSMTVVPNWQTSSKCGVTKQIMTRKTSRPSHPFSIYSPNQGKSVDKFHAPKVLYCQYFWVSPLLPAMWAVLYNSKKHIDDKFFSIKRINVFKAGKILAGINPNTLDNVDMTTNEQPPYNPTPLNKIYDLKPLRTVEHLPLSFFTFFVVMFKPRNIQDSELKPWRREMDYFQQKVIHGSTTVR